MLVSPAWVKVVAHPPASAMTVSVSVTPPPPPTGNTEREERFVPAPKSWIKTMALKNWFDKPGGPNLCTWHWLLQTSTNSVPLRLPFVYCVPWLQVAGFRQRSHLPIMCTGGGIMIGAPLRLKPQVVSKSPLVPCRWYRLPGLVLPMPGRWGRRRVCRQQLVDGVPVPVCLPLHAPLGHGAQPIPAQAGPGH
jgi:hypothetical protein